MRIKVCGLTQVEQVKQLEEMGVALAGFIFYPRSPRYVANHIAGPVLKKMRGKIIKVGVFVNPEYDDIMRRVDEYGLDMVQLHGDETPKFCERIADYISVIKVFRMGGGSNKEWIMQPYRPVSDMFMFDTDGAGFGGTGKKFDWEELNQLNINKLFLLSGGLGPGDEARINAFAAGPKGDKLFAIDVNSRFETSPGVKDMKLLQNFCDELGINL
jgi:phosphoribosylanthranilate isomerase